MENFFNLILKRHSGISSCRHQHQTAKSLISSLIKTTPFIHPETENNHEKIKNEKQNNSENKILCSIHSFKPLRG